MHKWGNIPSSQRPSLTLPNSRDAPTPFNMHCPSTQSLLAILLSSTTCKAQSPPSQTSSSSALVPYVYSAANAALPFTDPLLIDIVIGDFSTNTTTALRPLIDTGTCGYVVSAADLLNWPPANLSDYPLGWEFLSSSKKLYSGRWIPQDVLFPGAAVEVRARFPVLAVEDTAICPGYNESTDTNSCAAPTNGTALHLPKGISLFGVGFGRQGDGQPQGNPDKNPFLNVVSVDGVETSGGTGKWNAGYIITKDGFSLGLTGENTAGMDFVELEEGVNHEEYPMDWLPVSVCIAVDEIPCVNGTALLDTGISQAYLTLPLSLNGSIHRHTAQSPSSGADVLVLDDGSRVQLAFGDGLVDGFAVVNATTTNITDSTPTMVITTLSSTKAPYINPGRHFYRGWEVAFDAVGGRLGFRAAMTEEIELDLL